MLLAWGNNCEAIRWFNNKRHKTRFTLNKLNKVNCVTNVSCAGLPMTWCKKTQLPNSETIEARKKLLEKPKTPYKFVIYDIILLSEFGRSCGKPPHHFLYFSSCWEKQNYVRKPKITIWLLKPKIWRRNTRFLCEKKQWNIKICTENRAGSSSSLSVSNYSILAIHFAQMLETRDSPKNPFPTQL